jgi:hypothetical protein
MQRPPPTLYVHFTVSGEFDPDEVTKRTGLSPTRTWRRGDRRRHSGRIVSDDCWDYRTGPVEDSDIGPHLRAHLQALITHTPYFTDLSRTQRVSFTVTISIWTPEHPLSYAPIVFIEPQLLSAITGLGASLEVDLNLLADEDTTSD